jgi:hypothetical protein
MEYTRSVGEYYEMFEGTPKEIAELISLLDDQVENPPKMTIKIPDVPNLGLPNSRGNLKGGEE